MFIAAVAVAAQLLKPAASSCCFFFFLFFFFFFVFFFFFFFLSFSFCDETRCGCTRQSCALLPLPVVAVLAVLALVNAESGGSLADGPVRFT